MASRSWNRVELIGNLTRDPELRFTPNGAAVCTFGMATNRTYVTEGEKREEVDFHRLVAWNKLAELCNQLLKKGNRVFVSGRLQTRSWEGQDGQTRQTTEIVIEDMILLTPKSISEEVSPPPEEFTVSAVPAAKSETVSEPKEEEPKVTDEATTKESEEKEKSEEGDKGESSKKKGSSDAKTESGSQTSSDSAKTDNPPPSEDVDDLPF